MLRRAIIYSTVLVVSLVLLPTSYAQVSTGITPFGSFGGGPFDVVNLGNLNVHFTIPILHKAGRGMPFTYDLSYDSSIWTPVVSSGTSTWQPVTNWGWRGQTEAQTGYVSHATTSSPYCVIGSTTYGTLFSYTNWMYHDAFGVAHPFPGETEKIIVHNPDCGSSSATAMTATTSDGSGYTLIANGSLATSVTSRTGAIVVTPTNAISGSGSGTDANGNQITVDNNGNLFDTLSSTTPVLIVAGLSTSSSPLTFSYIPPANEVSGTRVSVTANYVDYTVKTNFGATDSSGHAIGEFGPTTVSLVDNITLPDGTKYKFTYETTPGSCTPNAGTQPTCVTARIKQVTLATGGVITYTYSGGANGIENDGSTAGLTRMLSPVTSCGSNPSNCWSYSRTLVSGSPGPGSMWTTKVTDPNGNDSVMSFAEDGATTTSTTSATYNFYETQRQSYQGSVGSGLLLTTVTCYNGNTSSCATTTVSSPINNKSVTLQFPNNGLQAKTATTYNTFGLVTEVDQYAYASGAPTVLAQKTQIIYASLGNGIVDRPSSISVKDGGGAYLSYTLYNYDETAYPIQQPTTSTPQHGNITGSRGNVTTISRGTTATTTLVSHLQYYDTGTLYKSFDVNGATTTYTYGTAPQGNSTISCGNSFPTSVTLPITGLSTSRTYDCIGGVVLTSTDVNGKVSTTTYNDTTFWRPASTADPTTATISLTYTGYNSGTQAPANVDSKMLFNGGNSVVEQLSTIGGFGQLLYSQQREGPNSASYDSTQLFYDAFVRPYQATMPCVTTVGQGCPSAAKTTTTFDALGRPTKTTDGGTTPGYVSSAYTQNDVLQSVGPAPSGENLKQKQLEYDAVGRLISVCEITNLTGSGVCGQNSSQPNGYWTKYAYGVNASGNPTVTVTQNAQASTGQQTRVYTYDLLGRLIAEQNPENATTTYTYDSVAGSYCANTGAYSSPGDLVAKADANGNHTCYYYDVLHRVTDVGNNNQSATNSCKRFRYDNSLGVLGAKPSGITVNNGLGRMVEAETDTCASPITQSSIITDEWFSYSARGELTDTYESTLHSGGYYHVTQGYWANGAMSSLSSNITGLPNQTYGVDSMGRTSTVSASTGQKPVTSTTYNLSAFTYGVTFGSGDSDTFNLDPKTGRMTKYTFTVASNSDIGQTNWNPDGSLASLNITDTVPGTTDTQNCNFAHDDLARISSVNCANGATNKWNQNFAYDAFGNISKTVPTGGTGITFPGSLPAQAYSSSTNWLTTISGCTPTYDSDGQLTYDCVHHYTWNAASKMVSVDSTTTLTYDAQGRMVEKAIGSTFTQVVYGPYGRCALMSGQTLVKAFIPLPTGAQAVYTPSGLAYYRHHDHLGSSRLATTPSRTLYSSTAYAPFGEPYAQAGATDLSFTGQDQDTVSGIHDFLFRKYVPVQGRWLSPDPAGLDAVNPASPQSWNRYGYVMNNPVSFIDPLGLGPCSKEGESSGHCSGGGEPGCIWDDSTATLTCLISPEPGDPCIGCGDSNPGQEGQNGGGGSDGNSQLDRAIINALKLLQNTKCADLIDRGTGIATALLTQAQNGQAPVGTIGESISVGTTPSGLSAVTQPTGFGTSSITISPTGDFFNSNSSGFQDLTRAGYQSLVILHEIGHAVGYFMGNNPMYPSRGGYNTSATGIQPDKGNSYLGGFNGQNNFAVYDACFGSS